MVKYKLTLARAVLFSFLLGTGIIYLVKDGVDEMTTTEIMMSFGLLFILLVVLLSGAVSLLKKEE